MCDLVSPYAFFISSFMQSGKSCFKLAPSFQSQLIPFIQSKMLPFVPFKVLPSN